MAKIKLMLMMLITILVCSCSSDELSPSTTASVSNDEVALQNLIEKEDSLCKELFGTTTRADNKPYNLTKEQWQLVMIADVKGFVRGKGNLQTRAAYAAVASLAKYMVIVIENSYRERHRKNSVMQIAPINNAPSYNKNGDDLRFVLNANENIFNDTNHVGYWHNRIIIELFDEYPRATDWLGIDDVTACNRVFVQMKRDGLVESVPIVKAEDIKDVLGYTNYEYDELTQSLVPSGRQFNTEVDKFDDLLFSFTDGLSKANDNNKRTIFITSYINNVDKSDLSQEDKTNLKYQLNIALASSMLWNLDYFYGLSLEEQS